MIRAAPALDRLGHVLAFAVFAAILVGLPAAVELGIPAELVSSGLNQGSFLVRKRPDATAITTPIDLSEHLALTLDGGLVSLAVADAGLAGAPTRLLIDEPTLTLDLTRPGVANRSRSAPNAPPIVARLAAFKSGTLQLRRGALTVISASGARYSFRNVDATIASTRLGSYRLQASGTFNGQTLQLDGNWSEPAGKTGQPPVPIRLQMRSAYIEATFDGMLRTGGPPVLAGEARFRIPSLRRLVAWTGLGKGIGDQMRNIVVSGPLTWSTARMAFAPATVDINGNRATGALTLEQTGPRPSIDATLAFDELDLRPAFVEARAQSIRPGTRSATSRLLATFDADLRLSAGRIRAPAVELGRGAITIALNQGRLAAGLVGIEIEGGIADGQLLLDVNEATPKADIKLTAKGVDIGHILSLPLQRNPLTGRANVVFEGTAQGGTLLEAASRLAGHGQVELASKGRLSLDLAALVHAIKVQPVVSWAAAGNGSTALDKLKCRFRVLNGALKIEALRASNSAAVIIGNGQVDVPGRLLDLYLGSGPPVAGEAPIVVQTMMALRGTWASPAISQLKADPPTAGLGDAGSGPMVNLPRSH